jgi:hypothetical protein
MTPDRSGKSAESELEARVDALKREVDALQVHLMAKASPWYKQVPLVVSLLVSLAALGFSFWTNHKSEERLERQDRTAAHAELRSLIQRLQALPKEVFTASRTYSKDPAARNAIAGFITAETLVLTQQVVQLIEELEGEVGGTAYYAASYALGSTNQWAEAEAMVEKGLAVRIPSPRSPWCAKAAYFASPWVTQRAAVAAINKH